VTDIERDRDPVTGRARNARPRDGLGRPLPRGSASDIERVPDELHMTVDETVTLAQTYIDAGRPFHAHEVLEALWKTRSLTERDLWQGLAQVAVGLTHALRGNPTGAVTLLRRGAGRLDSYISGAGANYGVDVAGVRDFSLDVAQRLAKGIDVTREDAMFKLRGTPGS
jgi:hypothetical protein